jgi:hypothetical protein
MDKASCLSNHVVSGDRRKGEIDEDARGVYLVWLDGNGMRDVGGVGARLVSPIPPSEMERKSCC